MAEKRLNKDQIPVLNLTDLEAGSPGTPINQAGSDAFLGAQNAITTPGDRFALQSELPLTQERRVGLFSNNGFACGLDCWENESPYPLATYPLTETERVRVIHSLGGPVGDTFTSCGCPGMEIQVLEGFQGCSFEVVAQRRDFKCCDFLVCGTEMTLEFIAYFWGSNADTQVKPVVRLQYFNEGYYIGEETKDIHVSLIGPGVDGAVNKLDASVSIAIPCCADEVRAILGFEAPSGNEEASTFTADLNIFVQSFQLIGTTAAEPGHNCNERYDGPIIESMSAEGDVTYSMASCQEVLVIERSESAYGNFYDYTTNVTASWTPESIFDNQELSHASQRVGWPYSRENRTVRSRLV